jgi:signal peptidase I
LYGVTSQEWQRTLPCHIEGDDVVVPPNSYLGMGDNRDVSKDSRYWSFIPLKNVIGRPMFVYWSFVTPADEYQKRGAGDRAGVSGAYHRSLLR